MININIAVQQFMLLFQEMQQEQFLVILSMNQISFFRRIKEELQKNRPDIKNLLFTNEINGEEQQFNDFVLKHLNKYIINHLYYEELKKTLLGSLNQSQLFVGNQHNMPQVKQPIDNQLRVYVTKLVKIEKELRKYEQSINKSELSLKKLRYFDFGDEIRRFDEKISKLVEKVNNYEQFLSNFSEQKLNVEQLTKKRSYIYSVNEFSEFIQNRFFQSMSRIQVYVMEYFQGSKLIQNYQLGLSQLQINNKFGLKQNIEMLCKSVIKNREEIQDAISISQQIIKSMKQNQGQKLRQKLSISEILKLLKKQINQLNFSRNVQPTGLSIFSYLPNILLDWFPSYFLKQSVNRIYNKLPSHIQNVQLSYKLNAIQQRIDYCNQTTDIVQKYTEPLNLLVGNCLFYFGIEYRSNILQPQYHFTQDELFILNQAIKHKIEEKVFPNRQQDKELQKKGSVSQKQPEIKNTQFIQDQSFQDVTQEISMQYQVTDLKNQDQMIYESQCLNMDKQMRNKENQMKQLTKKYQQARLELQKAKRKNLQLSKLLQRKMQHSESANQQKHKNISGNYLQKDKEESKSFPKEILYEFEQLNNQISRLKQENQVYLNQKIKLINQRDGQIYRCKQQFKQFLKLKYNQLDQLKRTCIQDKQKTIQRICIQHDKQRESLKAQITKIQEQYDDFLKKYYEQLQQRYNQSVMRIQRSRSKQHNQASFNTSMSFIACNQDNSDELNQIIKIKEQINKKLQDQVSQLKAKIIIINEQCQRNKIEKKNLEKILGQKQKLIDQLKQTLIKQQILKVNLQNELKKNVQDFKKTQQTLCALQANIQSQRKVLEERRQNQEKQKQSNQFSSYLPTLVHYNRQLFNEDIFYDNQEEKKNLVNHIEWYARSRIKHTKLVYKFDQKNKINFHQYIDQIKGLALVIKTKHAILAGFYPGVFRDKQVLNKGGLIISVTNNNSYCLQLRKKGDTTTIYRGMIYDTFFAIYGNAQIRIKTGFKTVFSNFGISNSYFNSRGDKVEKLLNQGEKREVQFQYCQFYQITFENQSPNFR